MKCPICQREDEDPACKHLLAVVDEEEASCCGPASSLFDDFVGGRGCESDYENAIGDPGDDYLTRDEAIECFSECCRSIADRSASWSGDDQQVFGGRSTSYYAEDVGAALEQLEKSLGGYPSEENVRYQAEEEEDAEEDEEEDADEESKHNQRRYVAGSRPLPPLLPQSLGGPLSPGRVSQQQEAISGLLSRRATFPGKSEQPSPETSES